MTRLLFFIAALVVAMLVMVMMVGADAPESSEPTQQELMAMSMEMAQPGPEHLELAKMAGKWNQHVKMWMQPGTPPMEVTGTSEAKMILGGRFLVSEGEAMMMGQKFENLSIMGFDRRHKVYTLVGYDVMGTYYVAAEGKAENDGKTIRMYGEDHDPIFGFTQKYDMIYHRIHQDTLRFEVIFRNPEMTFGQDEFKMVEVTLTRAE